MNSRRLCSILLLIAMGYSLVHDYAFLLHDDQHSAQEYVSQFEAPSQNMASDLHDTHYEYHLAYILPAKRDALASIKREKSHFLHNEIFLSWNNFNFLKPPIV